jgi:hypothetical protein
VMWDVIKDKGFMSGLQLVQTNLLIFIYFFNHPIFTK